MFKKSLHKMIQPKALSSTFVLASLILIPITCLSSMDSIPPFNESEPFNLESIFGTSSCDASQTCKGKITCPACVKIGWVQREPYILKQTTEFATFAPHSGIFYCKYILYYANSSLLRSGTKILFEDLLQD